MPFPYKSESNVLGAGVFGYAAEDKFQLICAGLDGLYGGDLDQSESGLVSAAKDNITSTTDGMTIEDFLDR